MDADVPLVGCPEGFVLNFLWLENIVAISVDQTFSKVHNSCSSILLNTLLLRINVVH